MNPYELEQLVAFAELGTLAAVSELCHPNPMNFLSAIDSVVSVSD